MLKLRTLVCLVGYLAYLPHAYADEALNAFRLGQFHKAAKLYQEKAPQNGDDFYALGEMYLYGYGVPRHLDQAIQSYTKAAELNVLPAIQVMARYELFIKHQPQQALIWFKKAAELQDLSANMYCSAAYLYGLGTEINQDLAKKYFIAAAKQGDPLAQLTLAQHFFDAKSGKNTQLAWIWLNKACDKNYAPALIYKADLLNQGRYIAADPKQAAALLEQAAKQNELMVWMQKAQWAQNQQQWNEAIKLYQMAIEKGDDTALFSLANLYAKEGTPIYNPKEAFVWMDRAARLHQPLAQKQLVAFYTQGFGVEKNPAMADAWAKYLKNSPNAKLSYRFKQASLWLSAGKFQNLQHAPYALTGIWKDWKNPIAWQENHVNLAPQWFDLSLESLFKPNYVFVQPGKIPFIEYLDAIMAIKGPVALPKQLMPHYGLPNEGHISENDFKSLRHQANLGVSEAQFMLGQCYLHGLKTKVDLNLAQTWFEKARVQNELRAQYELALMNLLAHDEQLQKYGLQLLKDAAFKGNPHAEYTLGLLSELGFKDAKGKSILSVNLDQAKNMYRLASINDFGLAKFRLAEWLAREPLSQFTVSERAQKQLEIRSLYYEAVKNGIIEAKLPLAFFLAASKDPKKQEWALKTAEEFADEGNKEAALLAGLMMDRDTHNSNHTEDAMQWYAKAKKHPIGGFVWASLSPNQEKVKEYLEQAAQANFSYAYLNLAVLAHQNHQSELDYLKKAADMGNPLASHLLANQYVLSGKDSDLKQSVDIFQKLANKGDVEGQTKLGYLLVHGIGVTKDAGLGQRYLLDAASHHYVLAQYLLGKMYHIGQFSEGVNDSAAKYWLAQAASKDPASSINLGFIYETIDKSYDKAMNAYQHALPKLKFKSNYNLGLIYQYGKGQSMNLQEAELHFKEAMRSGAKQALNALGELYLYQFDNPDHQKLAFQWFEKAAKLGQVDAIYRLGLLYETGIGTPINYEQALNWYQKAADKGDYRGGKALERFHTYHLITADQSSTSSASFSQWVKGYFDEKPSKTHLVPVELQYLGVLDNFNQGQGQQATQDLMNIVKEYPHYAPAKNMLMQMQNNTTQTVKQSV